MKQEILALFLAGVPRSAICVRLKLTKNQVAGHIDRHLNPDRAQSRCRDRKKSVHHTWSDENLTEPWAKYHARKVAERAAAHP